VCHDARHALQPYARNGEASQCSLQLAHAGDVVNMSEEGIAGLFVNPHGCVHDMVTLRKVCPDSGKRDVPNLEPLAQARGL